jgi:hypothetical protein
MHARWYVAKYIPDMRRREAMNVGVVLVDGSSRIYRFLGQRADGSVDGRRLRWAGSAENYKAWLGYWTHELKQGASLNALLKTTADSSYYLEQGGERLVGDVEDTDGFLDDLYSTLVETSPDRDTLSIVRLSDTVLARAGIREHVTPQFRYRIAETDADDEVIFDYRFDNGAINLMQRVPLAFTDDRGWEAAHAAAWSFKQAMAHPVEPDRTQRCIALVKTRKEDDQLTRQLGFLERHADVVDVTEEEKASLQLRALLHL